MTRYVIPVTQGVLDPHFGHCEAFALIDADEKRKVITGRKIVPSPGHRPGFLPGWLAGQGARVVIAGGMGERAMELFAAHGIDVILGAQPMDPEAAVMAHLKGEMKSTGNACEEHRHGCDGSHG